jgi:hypothetical protein
MISKALMEIQTEANNKRKQTPAQEKTPISVLPHITPAK